MASTEGRSAAGEIRGGVDLQPQPLLGGERGNSGVGDLHLQGENLPDVAHVGPGGEDAGVLVQVQGEPARLPQEEVLELTVGPAVLVSHLQLVEEIPGPDVVSDGERARVVGEAGRVVVLVLHQHSQQAGGGQAEVLAPVFLTSLTLM